MSIYMPLEGLVDKEAERARLTKEIQKWETEVARFSKKLTNPAYCEKAPAEVVEKERMRLHAAELTLSKLTQERAVLS
ncbi:MAG: hypothetical protein A3J38_06015 [Gammaproteobacteria bacterium RIFCSPHIGHO2_12_FULL_45_9]|nr:MAG: hypothetical protein A3J38_06015 [Gammaproteobacteria bacterium RIFCSPHIGHO2_12_FULL_45_9]